MTDAPGYAPVLKRRPTQVRSARRVEEILDAAAVLLEDREPDQIGIRDLAQRAGVPTGTIYQFFADKDAVLQALALRYLAAMPGVLDAALSSAPGSWPETLDRVVDDYAAMVRREPAIRRLWLTGTLDAATRRIEQETDATLAARLGARLVEEAGSDRGTPDQWRTLVAILDGLLRLAFAETPQGDPALLRETRRAVCAYAAAVLGEPPGR